MRLHAAVASAFVLVTVVLALPSCSDDPSAATTGGDAGTEGGLPEGSLPPGDAAPDVIAPSGEYRSGTRLRAVVTSGGGTKLFNHFHDKMLDVDCSYVTLAGGARYCAPLSPRPGTVYFTDDKCTQKVVGWNATCAPATPDKYAQYADYSVGCPTPEVLELGAAAAPAMVYEKLGTACNAYAGPALTYRSVARTVAPSELVKATVTREPRGKQLSSSYLDGDDGSRQPLGIEDGAPHAGPCQPQIMGDGTLRCLPSIVAYVENAFSDATCMTEAAFKPGYGAEGCTLPPVAILATTPTTCFPYTPALFEPGAKAPGPYFQGAPGACSPLAATPPAGATYWGKGAAIADTAFASVKHVHGAGAPLGLESIAVDTGEVVQNTAFWDPARGATCTPGQAADGKTRCVGQTANIYAWADAGCTQPLAVVSQVPPTCTAPAVPTHIWFDKPPADNCGPSTLRAYKVGAKVTPAQVYSGSSCTMGTPDANTDYYATTGEVPASDLVELTVVTE